MKTVAFSDTDALNFRDLVREDRVHRMVYTDPAICELEMQRIFSKAWVYAGHESQVPRPGDFFCTDIARQPVVMVRHTDGKVYVIYNRCGHRGALVCNEESGNVRQFRCCYHGWTFRTNGDLLGVPARHGYPKDFDFSRPELGMVRVPRVDTYRGFVFASLSPDGPDLSEHLGPMKAKIDDLVNLAPDGEVELVGGCHKYQFRANWKLQVENADDLYHPFAAHESTAVNSGRQFKRREGDQHGFQVVAEEEGEAPEFFDKVPVGAFDYGHTWCGSIADPGKRGGDLYEEYVAALEAKYGKERTEKLLNVNWHVAVIYPNLLLQSLARYIRVVRPIAVDRTEVRIYPLRLKGAPKEWNRRIIKYINITHSAASLIQTDDVECFLRCQKGVVAQGADWVIFARGLGREIADYDADNAGGLRTDTGMSELVMRNQYKAWLRYMCSEI